MQYLKIRKGARDKRRNGAQYAIPMWVTKTRKYGTTLSEECISRRRNILFTGPHDAGKTRYLRRLFDDAEAIYGVKSKAPALWVSALRPLAAWVEDDHLAEWWNNLPVANPEQPKKAWHRLPQWARAEQLPNYLQDTGAVLFVDDAHKLQGRKLQIARECVLAARIWVASTSEENRIAPNLRQVMLRSEPQTFRLGSEVAYDATAVLMWIMVAIAAGMGAWEIALVLGGLRLLGSGRRAAKQE